MQAAHRGGREEPLDGVAGFEAEDAQVAQVRPGRATADLADAAEQAFDRQEIAIRIIAGHLEGERSIPASQVDFEGGSVCE